jgi:hypothetical protein
MRRTDHSIDSVDTVASLLLTIDRDDSGAFYTSVETMPPGPRVAQATNLPAYASEQVVDIETVLSAALERARAGKWRRCLIAAATVAVVVGGAVALDTTSGSTDSRPSPRPTVAPASANTFPPSSAGCPDTGGSACSDATKILPSLDTACTNLLTTAAYALDEDPQQWTQSLLVSMVSSGKPFADVIRQWLTGARADVLATRYADVHLDTRLDDGITRGRVDHLTCDRADLRRRRSARRLRPCHTDRKQHGQSRQEERHRRMSNPRHLRPRSSHAPRWARGYSGWDVTRR